MGIFRQMHFSLFVAIVFTVTSCDYSQPKSEPASAAVQQHKTASPLLPVDSVKPCEKRFTPMGMALTRAAMDTKTGQQCRTAENAPPASRSLPMCFDLFSQDQDSVPLSAKPALAPESCPERFAPIGMVLTRAALDTKTGRQCRTVENAPSAFRSLPMCADLLTQFPD